MDVFKTPLFKVLAVLVAALAGLSWQGFFKEPLPLFPSSFQNPGYHLVVASVEANEGRGWSVEAAPFGAATGAEGQSPARFLLLPALGIGLIPGDRLILWARPEQPPAALWKGVFDMRQYLAQKGLAGILRLDRPEDYRVLSSASGPLAWLHRFHERFSRRVQMEFPNPRIAGLLAGLLLGEKRLLEASLKQSFIRAGVMHLLVVSGLHVTVAFSFFFAFALWALRLNRAKATALALAATWAFAVFIGLNPPVLRSTVMVTILSLALGVRRETPVLGRLFLAALLFLAFQPSLIEDASFLLSFVSTFGIIYGWLVLGEPDSKRWWKTIAVCAATSLFAWLILLPFSAALFNEISLVAPISNLILVPFSSVLLGLGAAHFTCLTWVPLLGEVSRLLLTGACGLFITLTDFLAGIPCASVASSAWNALAIGSWFAGIMAAGLLASRRAESGGLRLEWAGKTVMAAGVFLLGLFFAQAVLAPPRIELLEDREKEKIIGMYVRHRWNGVLCLVQEAQISSEASALVPFLKSRGQSRLEDVCAGFQPRALAPPLRLVESLAFDPGHFRLEVSCGDRTLFFPFTIFKDSGQENEFFCGKGFL